jgi:hypothetical protein
MGQRIEIWQSGGGDRRWLASLIDAMEEAARPEIRSQPVESSILAAFRAQLARPAACHVYTPSTIRH